MEMRILNIKCSNDSCVIGTFHTYSATIPCAMLDLQTFILNKLAYVEGVILQPLNNNLWKL